MMYVLATNHSTVTAAEIEQQRGSISELYPTWVETQKWVRQVRTEVLGENGDTSFDATVRVLEEVGDRYGRWQNNECIDLKDSLLKLGEKKAGRVPLEAFYKSALDGNWQFGESLDYLRQLGAVDDSDGPHRLSIIVPNYVNSPTNC